jgi:hypothetical protein
MGHNDHIDEELSELLEQLIEDGEIKEGTAAFGITKLVIDGGLAVLSDKQRHVYDKFVAPLLTPGTHFKD